MLLFGWLVFDCLFIFVFVLFCFFNLSYLFEGKSRQVCEGTFLRKKKKTEKIVNKTEYSTLD